MKLRRLFISILTVNVVVVSTLFGGLASILPAKLAEAHHNLNTSDCYFTPKGPPNTTNEEGVGYMFRSVGVYAGHDASVKGRTAHSTCAFTRDELRYNWLLPDKVWLGPRGVTAAGAVYDGSGPSASVGNTSTLTGCGAPGCGVSETTNGNYIVAQDDTAMISYEGSIVHCIAFNSAQIPGPSCNPLNGNDVYVQGVAPNAQTTASPNHNCAWAGWTSTCYNNNGASGFQALGGSGFLNLPNSETPAQVNARERTSSTSQSQGFLSTINIEMWFRNTYSGGYGSELVLTFRYPQRNSECTLSGNTVNLGNVTAGSTQSPTITFKNNGREDWRHDWSDANDPRRTGTGTSTLLIETTSNSFATDQFTLPSGNQLITGNTAAPSGSNNGESISFTPTFTAPTVPGSYTIDYQIHIRAGTGSSGLRPIGEECSITFNVLAYPVGNISCTTTTVNTEENTPFNFGAGVLFNPAYAATLTGADITIADDDGLSIAAAGGLIFNSSGLPPPPTNTALRNFTVAGAGVGDYTVIYRFNSNEVGPINCPVTIHIVKKPYVKFFGGDVFAGGGFENSPGGCGNMSRIYTYFKPTDYSGSGSQYGATATYDGSGTPSTTDDTPSLNEFASGSLGVTGSSVAAPGILSFSNVTPYFPSTAGSPLTGGGFGALGCTRDYWADRNGQTVTNLNDTSIDVENDLATGAYFVTPGSSGGTLELNNGSSEDMTIPVNRKIVMYVDGDVYIRDNLVYDDCFYASGSVCVFSVDRLPSFKIVARGSIYVGDYANQDVDRLNGIYIAQERSAGVGGEFITCADDDGAFDPATEANNFRPGGICDGPLSVVGAVIAQRIKLHRTWGSLRNSTAGEQGRNSSLADSSGDLNTQTPAESFYFSPEIYLTGLANCVGTVLDCKPGPYDAITSLPPIL